MERSSSAPLRAVTYGRQSKAREDDSQGSPQAQKLSARAFCDARGWRHVAHFEDIGISGYDPKAGRPGLAALLAAVRRREADIVVVYRLDRLTRRGVVEAVRLVGELNDNGAALASVSEPFLDTSTPMGRGIFALFAAMAEQESANISARSKATKDLLRQAGSSAGGQRLFGTETYRTHRDGLSLVFLRPHPTEGPVIAEVARRVIGDGLPAPASVAGEARRLNAAGIRTVTGSEWSTSSLGRVLQSPALAGIVSSRRGDIVRGEDGAPLRLWEGPLDEATFYRLADALKGRAAGKGPVREDSSLLGTWGSMRCAGCGGPLYADRRAGESRGSYRCARHRRGLTCPGGGCAISILHTDDYVARSVWERAAALDPSDPGDLVLLREVARRYNDAHEEPSQVEARSNALAVIADAEAGLAQLDDDRAAGVFAGASGTERYRRQAAALVERAEAARASLAALPSARGADDVLPLLDALSDVRQGMAYDDPEAPWVQWSVAERQEFLSLFLDAVIVTKGEGRGGGTVVWRGAERVRLVWALPREPGEAAPF